jgi:hypothetical protein
MKLETPLLDKFIAITRASGTETLFTVRLPSGESAQIDINAVFREIHEALHSLHHFIDPDGAHHTGFPVITTPVQPKDNPTGQAMIGP